MHDFITKNSRDLLGLGSWIFYFLVLFRAMIEVFRPFIDHMVVGGIVLVGILFFFKEIDDYIAKGLLLVVFTSMFYNDIFFTVFSSLIGILLVYASYYLNTSLKKIINGIIAGSISILCAFLWSWGLGLM